MSGPDLKSWRDSRWRGGCGGCGTDNWEAILEAGWKLDVLSGI